jgi:DeoR/GlpR family transcriptional regulator of sugar metabolism
MHLNSRQEQTLAALKDNRRVAVRELAARFDVSEMTIRRDLALLEERGLLTRTHGGGVDSQKVTFELFMGERLRHESDAKKAIARRAALLVSPGDTIILDTGTTVFMLADHLDDVADLTVATPSLAVASSLFWRKSARLIVLGGYVKSWSPDLVGSLTEENIAKLHFRKAFLGADGIDPDVGFFCNDLGSANVVKQIIAASDEVFVMADSSKIGVKSLIKYADFDDVNLLITDARDSAKLRLVEKKVKTVVG